MNRRSFLKQTAIAAPFVIGLNCLSCRQRAFFQSLMPEINYKNRVLVLIELMGGNDGLNTIIPLDKYESLLAVRKDILIPEKKILRLPDTDIFGLHPSLTGLQKLYNDKLISVVQGVGYPNPEFSHFQGKRIKYTANTDKVEIRTGWVGRYLDESYPNYPKGYPLHSTDGPAAIRIGAVSSKITQFMSGINKGLEEDIGVGFSNIEDFDSSAQISEETVTDSSFAASNLDVIRDVSKRIKLYSPIIQTYSSRQKNLSKLYPEPSKNPLADQLRTIARLIGSGLNTPVYIVSQDGYDTHADQVERSDTTLGKHASLLKDLSEAITAFEDDIHLMGKQENVLGMTFSEFGRRIQCGSYGTDHGTAESVILFGTALRHGIIGSSPDLPKKITDADNLTVQYDFRALYRSVLSGWFGVPEEKLKNIIPQGQDNRPVIFKT